MDQKDRQIAELEAELAAYQAALHEQSAQLESLAAHQSQTVATVEELVQQIEQLADDLAQARDDAEAASRAKATFLANMSHTVLTERNCQPNAPQRGEVLANRGLRCGANQMGLSARTNPGIDGHQYRSPHPSMAGPQDFFGRQTSAGAAALPVPLKVLVSGGDYKSGLCSAWDDLP